MIMVSLKGGLGNQMFQYAAGRRLSCLHNVPLKLDLSWFREDLTGVTPRSYALDHFSINAEPATMQEISRLYEPHAGRVKRFLNFMNPIHRKTCIYGKHFHFDSSILELPDNICLDGYWQSEKYFQDIAAVIRSDFTLSVNSDVRNQEVVSMINECNSVSIHIRRGDYINDKKTAAKYMACSNDYYLMAMDIMSTRAECPHFFVFTDDSAWVREHFEISHSMTLVGNNGPDKAYEDLRLMSLCTHHIIANSSFSWWGAWLNHRLDKIVIAPSRWFNDPKIDTSDLMPASWLRIDP